MHSHDRISERQLNVLAYTSLLSPMIRLLPHAPIILGGKVSWLSPIAAAIGSALWLLFIKAFFKDRRQGEGLMEMCRRYIGKPLTSVLMLLMALWLIFYCGFLLRTSAERFLSAVYSNGNTPFFVIVTLTICMVATVGTVKSLARSSEVFVLIINVIFVVVAVFSLSDIKLDYLLPVTFDDSPDILLGALPIINIIGLYSYATFLLKYVDKTPGEGKNIFRWMFYFMAFALVIMFITIGSSSAQLSVDLQSPFFIMVRNVTIIGFIDRIESVLVAVWVATDFLFLSFLYFIIGDVGKALTSAKSRRPFVLSAGGLSAVCAFVIANNAFDLRTFSEKLVPLANLGFAFVLLPVIFLFGKIRNWVYNKITLLKSKQH